jgi:uncharacterized membrane protein
MEEAVHSIEQGVEVIGLMVDVFGVVIIVGGLIWSIGRWVQGLRSHPEIDHYQTLRTRIGRVLLLGLEILVAADIIRTVAVAPTFTSVGVLALLVLVRTFLNWALVLEIEGCWPWQAVNPMAEVDLTK